MVIVPHTAHSPTPSQPQRLGSVTEAIEREPYMRETGTSIPSRVRSMYKIILVASEPGGRHYNETSLNRPDMGPTLKSPFIEVVALGS